MKKRLKPNEPNYKFHWIRILALRKTCEKGPYAPILAPKHTGDKALLLNSSLEIPDFWLEFSSIDLKCN